jgi:hypothetical protein
MLSEIAKKGLTFTTRFEFLRWKKSLFLLVLVPESYKGQTRPRDSSLRGAASWAGAGQEGRRMDPRPERWWEDRSASVEISIVRYDTTRLSF